MHGGWSSQFVRDKDANPITFNRLNHRAMDRSVISPAVRPAVPEQTRRHLLRNAVKDFYAVDDLVRKRPSVRHDHRCVILTWFAGRQVVLRFGIIGPGSILVCRRRELRLHPSTRHFGKGKTTATTAADVIACRRDSCSLRRTNMSMSFRNAGIIAAGARSWRATELDPPSRISCKSARTPSNL